MQYSWASGDAYERYVGRWNGRSAAGASHLAADGSITLTARTWAVRGNS